MPAGERAAGRFSDVDGILVPYSTWPAGPGNAPPSTWRWSAVQTTCGDAVNNAAPSARRTAAQPSPPISGTSAVSPVDRLPVLGPAGDGPVPVPATPAGVPTGVPGALPAGVPPGGHRRQGRVRRSAAPWRLGVAPNSSANAGHQQLPAGRRWLGSGIRHQLTESSVLGRPHAISIPHSFPFPFRILRALRPAGLSAVRLSLARRFSNIPSGAFPQVRTQGKGTSSGQKKAPELWAESCFPGYRRTSITGVREKGERRPKGTRSGRRDGIRTPMFRTASRTVSSEEE
jgi:hypothetical protein